PLCVDGDTVDARELAGRRALLTPRLHEHAVLREFGDARIAAAVGDEDVALRVPCDVGRTIEKVLRRSRARRTTSAAATTFGPAITTVAVISVQIRRLIDVLLRQCAAVSAAECISARATIRFRRESARSDYGSRSCGPPESRAGFFRASRTCRERCHPTPLCR